jgi:endonuclease/exonuclease/phosphatase family metal-dependent hydrolase
LPILRAENHRSPLLAKTLLEIEVALDGESASLFATHLGSRHDVPKAVTEIPVILDAMRRLGDRPHLLVGDLNALGPVDPVGEPPPGVTRRGEAVDGAPRPAIPLLLARGYRDGYRALHPESPGYTYPADAPWLRLDYIFLSPSLAGRLAGCDVVAGPEAARASDHLPIWAEIT